MNAVGIDVSKGKSMIAVMRPFGEVVASPFEVTHTASELGKLASYLVSLGGETKVVMEYTGNYYQPIARVLHEAGLFVSIVHAKLIHDYGNNSIRKVKTDKKDAIKIANYGLDRWLYLAKYIPEEDIRQTLKTYNRQYNKYSKFKVSLKNNLISLLDQVYPGVNTLFSSPPREDGRQKWLDFTAKFWHCQCVCDLTLRVFTERYRKWCKKEGYNFSESKADAIYAESCGHIGILPKSESTRLLITQAVAQINAISKIQVMVLQEMKRLAAMLPEYQFVMSLQGVGSVLGPQLMAEIGDVYRFDRKQALVAFAGLDAPPYQSGKFESTDRSISKKGSPHLRKTLFQVMIGLLQTSPADDPVYSFLDRKRAEGKHYYVYMNAAAAKFLRIYYARVKESLNSLESEI
ncbi:IS110 family RNA-guided transposase [Dethiobacter alkaliphilus]|uniref:IS110 family transposase n=1 Tax=Dethiobacter alkaliphilus TaxID=427926 RepID=UPI002225CFC8|nr:IS110 family transposase [Dethiobacter alkaliphilus]MCW3490261.1 IS110 family transposase [Dethiobacter alkaliphilus]